MPMQQYNGDEKIVIAIDCGTTMTAVSYSHLIRGVVPKVGLVSRWPFQEEAAGHCKFPTVVRYDLDGVPISFGAAAVEDPSGLEGTSLVKWFKLLLHPKEMREDHGISVPKLPPNVSLQRVYADILDYTFKHTVEFFTQSTIDGPAIWSRLGAAFELILAIPNGWGETQQAFLRDAAVTAQILPEGFDPRRLRFVSEAEASVHFFLEYAVAGGYSLAVGDEFGVSDMGGSTVDTTMYRCVALRPELRLTEVTASECVQAGSVLVDDRFRMFLRERLAGSRFSGEDYVDKMMDIFDTKTKRRYRGDEPEIIVRFGVNADTDLRYGIRMGRLTLSSEDMRAIFEPSLSAISASVLRLFKNRRCTTFLAVGGFAENSYLRDALKERADRRGIEFVFTPEPTKKAAAEGACLWSIKQHVLARAARYTYGVENYRPYEENKPAHLARNHLAFVDETGDLCLPGFFDILVKKNRVLNPGKPRTVELHRVYDHKPTDLGNWKTELYATKHTNPGPWTQNETGELLDSLSQVCLLTADLSGLSSGLRKRRNAAGKPYWRIDYSVEIYFGGTSLSAAIVWNERGTKMKGPVTIIPNSVIVSA